MGRLHIISLLALGVLLASTQQAHAQSGMCADATVERSELAPRSDAERELREVDLVIDVIAGVELSALELAPPLAPSSEDDLPWCTSPNDARCSKLPAGSESSRFEASASSLPALTETTHAMVPTSAPARVTPHRDAGPRAGVQLRVERPPR